MSKREKQPNEFYAQHPKLPDLLLKKVREKKRKKVTLERKLFIKAERLWKEIAYLRDGEICQVKAWFPQLQTTHTDILQVDHCFSRQDKNLFFDPRNSTVVCAGCNTSKGFKNEAIRRAIDKIVMDREGPAEFTRMADISISKKPNLGWGNIWWLEQVVKDLEEYKQSIGRTHAD